MESWMTPHPLTFEINPKQNTVSITLECASKVNLHYASIAKMAVNSSCWTFKIFICFISLRILALSLYPNHLVSDWLDGGLFCFGAPPVPLVFFFKVDNPRVVYKNSYFLSVFRGQAAQGSTGDANNFETKLKSSWNHIRLHLSCV